MNTKMFDALRALNLPIDEYLIIGSGALGIRNLRAIGDIDILVTPQLWDILAKQYGVTVIDNVERITFPGDIVEAFRFAPLTQAEIIEGLPFESLENLLKFKSKMGREKDLKDIALILNLPDATLTRIDHSDAMVADVYKVDDGTILKICDRANNEAHYLQFFAGKIPVPKIIKHIPGAILMECLPGELLTTLKEPLAFEIGATLAKIHLNRTPERSDYALKFEEGMEECKDHLPKELLAKCRQYYDTHAHLLNTVDGPCVAHRDFRAGNILVHNGKLSGIIDWASGSSSFAEEDFCAFEHGEFPLDETSNTAFLTGYASIRPVPNYQAIMPFLRMNKALATIGFTVKQNTFATCNAAIYHRNRIYLEKCI